MTRTVLAAVLLLAAPAALAAQADASPVQQDPQAAYNKLAKEFNKAMSEWQSELEATIEQAKKDGKRVPRAAYRQPTGEFVATAQEHAQQLAGKDDAVMFLTFILKNASSERNAVKWAIKTLASDHAKSAAIVDALDHLPNAMRISRRDVEGLLDEVAENHEDVDVRSRALLVRGRMRLELGREKQGIADLKKVVTTSKDEDLLEEANEALYEVERLAVGAVAPEIEGVDVDGVAFKLSDYRGKVVLLDFWGFW